MYFRLIFATKNDCNVWQIVVPRILDPCTVYNVDAALVPPAQVAPSPSFGSLSEAGKAASADRGGKGEDGAGGLVSVHAPFNPGYNTSTYYPLPTKIQVPKISSLFVCPLPMAYFKKTVSPETGGQNFS